MESHRDTPQSARYRLRWRLSWPCPARGRSQPIAANPRAPWLRILRQTHPEHTRFDRNRTVVGCHAAATL